MNTAIFLRTIRVKNPRISRGVYTAAGAASDPVELAHEGSPVRLPIETTGEDLFAIRATGDSMDGGKAPIRDGDWLIMRFARGATADAVAGKVALIETQDDAFGHGYRVKRLVRDDSGWTLRSDNPARGSFAANEHTRPIATLVQVVRPEELAPQPGERIGDDRLATAFGLDGPLQSGRVEGHLFLMIERRGSFVAPDRIHWPVSDRRPGETAYVLARASGDDMWLYVGVAQYLEDKGLWASPPLNDASWQALS